VVLVRPGRGGAVGTPSAGRAIRDKLTGGTGR
jgi:hypothetical protein